MDYDASGKLLLEHHGNGIGTQNRYHPTRGFLESSRTLRWTTNAHLQEYEMQLDDLGNGALPWAEEGCAVGTSIQRHTRLLRGLPGGPAAFEH